MAEVDSAKIRVLVVEDDEDDYVLLCRLLSEVNPSAYQVTWTNSYDGALKELDSGNYDICLLDYLLGSHSGLDILRNTAAGPGKPPVIVLTGYGDYEVDLEAMKHGAADYLMKDQLEAYALERAIRYTLERKRSQDALSESEKQLKYLSSQLLVVQEAERRKVAAELHDNVSQLLTALKFNIETIIIRMDPKSSCTNDLRSIVPLIQGAVEQVRNMYTQLVPTLLDDLGITATLTWYCREFLHAHPDIDLFQQIEVNEKTIPRDLKLVIFRIVQEAMANVGVHGCAGHVSLRLSEEYGDLRLDIEDNGQGFEVDRIMSQFEVDQGMSLNGSAKGLGLVSMKRRAELSGGSFQIESNIGKGTSIRLLWPKPANSDR